jgi:hypothetical protein
LLRLITNSRAGSASLVARSALSLAAQISSGGKEVTGDEDNQDIVAPGIGSCLGGGRPTEHRPPPSAVFLAYRGVAGGPAALSDGSGRIYLRATCWPPREAWFEITTVRRKGVMSEKKLYQQKMQAQLDKWKATVDMLKAKASGVSADAKLKLNQRVKDLEVKIDEGKA